MTFQDEREALLERKGVFYLEYRVFFQEENRFCCLFFVPFSVTLTFLRFKIYTGNKKSERPC